MGNGDRKESSKVIYAAVAANAGIAIAKFIVAGISGSAAILSEGIHSVVDTANECLLMLGQRRSQRESSPDHPFGHGKEMYFWSLIVAVLLFGLGGGMAFYEGLTHVLHPEPVRGALWNYVVLAIAAVLESVSFFFAYRAIGAGDDPNRPVNWWRRVRRSKDPSIFSVFAEDLAALLGIVVAAIGVTLSAIFNSPYFDGAASMIIGLILASVAVLLAHESRKLLVGEAASPDTVAKIHDVARQDAGVLAVSTPRTMQLSADQLLVTLDVQVRPSQSADEAAATLERMETRIRAAVPDVQIVSLQLRRAAAPDRGDQQERAPSAKSRRAQRR